MIEDKPNDNVLHAIECACPECLEKWEKVEKQVKNKAEKKAKKKDMSGECEKCGEHCLDCVCDDQSLTTCSDFPLGLAASIIKRNLQETQLTLAFQSLEEVGMVDEFQKFISGNVNLHVFDAMREFAKLHPENITMND